MATQYCIYASKIYTYIKVEKERERQVYFDSEKSMKFT